MINLKRFPGVLFRYKRLCLTSCVFTFGAGLLILYFMHHWGYMCTNHHINKEIEKLCMLYEMNEAVGNLCQPLCKDKFFHSIACFSQHSTDKIAFTAKWREKTIVVKSATTDEKILIPSIEINNSKKYEYGQKFSKSKIQNRNMEETLEVYPINLLKSKISERDMELEIRNLVADRLNMSLTREQLDSLRYLEIKNKYSGMESQEKRRVEKENILELLKSQEYLLSRLFSDKEVFPKILGTCGHFYAVEHLDAPSFGSVFALDDKAEWSERMKLAIAIMDLVEILETDFPDALYLCDVRMSHFGVTKSGRVKFLDGSLVFPKSVLDKTLKSESRCSEHKDCDLFDCRSKCNLNEAACDAGVVNDNLQVICEKIFIGWTMSGKVIIPGLLMSENTPASLSALLRLCAENGRQSVPEDLRQRLYNIISEMHQILMQRLFST